MGLSADSHQSVQTQIKIHWDTKYFQSTEQKKSQADFVESSFAVRLHSRLCSLKLKRNYEGDPNSKKMPPKEEL